MASRRETERMADEVQKNLPPDLALLLSAMRAEFDAKLSGVESRMMMKLAFLGIPVGAVGGFVAELVRPGSPAQIGRAALIFLPWV